MGILHPHYRPDLQLNFDSVSTGVKKISDLFGYPFGMRSEKVYKQVDRCKAVHYNVLVAISGREKKKGHV